MSSYLTIAVVCLLIVRLKTFQLTRGLKDKFANPEYVNGDSCSASQCAQYFARCETKSCTVCVCDEVRPTYVASQKRCVKDDDIFPPTVPEYSSFVISSPNGPPYMAASQTSIKLDHEFKYTGNLNQLWLYTPSKKLLNLKTLKCLDFKDTVDLRHCNSLVESSTTQTWYCNSSSQQLHGRYKGTTLNLDFSGQEFYLGPEITRWVANKGNGTPSRSICDIPDTYKGCYRYTDGSSVKRFIHQSQLIDCTDSKNGICYEKFRILAPIFKEDGYSASCFIVWHKSMFSVNDQPWSKINLHENSFHYVGEETTTGEIEFRFLESTKKAWAGALLKLEVECKNQKIGTEQHCMLLKFDGVFESTKNHSQPTKNRPNGGPESSNLESRYKSSTIALSVVLAVIVLLIMIVVAVVIYRRRSPRGCVIKKSHNDNTSEPFYNSEEHL